MTNSERYWRYYFLSLQTLDSNDLEIFFKRNYTEFLLRESDLTLNGIKVDNDRRREIIGAFITAEFNSGDTIKIIDNEDILETSGIEISQETFIERALSQLPHETASLKNSKLIEKIKAYKKFINNKLELIRHPIHLKHRLEAIIYKYKAEARYIPNEFHPAEIEKEFGVKRKQAIYTIWNEKGKTYKKASKEELEKIIPLLTDYPNARNAAINDLDKLS